MAITWAALSRAGYKYESRYATKAEAIKEAKKLRRSKNRKVKVVKSSNDKAKPWHVYAGWKK